MNEKDVHQRLVNIGEVIRINPDVNMDNFDDLMDDLEEASNHESSWSNDSRPAPQVHFRCNVQGLKRVPDATFTMDGDIRDMDMAEFWKQRDAFQREVDRRFPLETLAHFAELPPEDTEGG